MGQGPISTVSTSVPVIIICPIYDKGHILDLQPLPVFHPIGAKGTKRAAGEGGGSGTVGGGAAADVAATYQAFDWAELGRGSALEKLTIKDLKIYLQYNRCGYYHIPAVQQVWIPSSISFSYYQLGFHPWRVHTRALFSASLFFLGTPSICMLVQPSYPLMCSTSRLPVSGNKGELCTRIRKHMEG